MSIWKRYETHGFPSHITTVVANRRPIFRDDRAASHLSGILHDAAREEHASLLAFAIMPDHLHIVVSIERRRSLGRLIQIIKGRFAREHNLAMGRLGSVWQDRYYERTLRSEEQLLMAVQYVLYNPVEVGLVKRPDDYKWSSADGLRGWSG